MKVSFPELVDLYINVNIFSTILKILPNRKKKSSL